MALIEKNYCYVHWMALNTSKCNHLTPLCFKGLIYYTQSKRAVTERELHLEIHSHVYFSPQHSPNVGILIRMIRNVAASDNDDDDCNQSWACCLIVVICFISEQEQKQILILQQTVHDWLFCQSSREMLSDWSTGNEYYKIDHSQLKRMTEDRTQWCW